MFINFIPGILPNDFSGRIHIYPYFIQSQLRYATSAIPEMLILTAYWAQTSPTFA